MFRSAEHNTTYRHDRWSFPLKACMLLPNDFLFLPLRDDILVYVKSCSVVAPMYHTYVSYESFVIFELDSHPPLCIERSSETKQGEGGGGGGVKKSSPLDTVSCLLVCSCMGDAAAIRAPGRCVCALEQSDPSPQQQ